jgi:hypothetical protein
MAQRRFAGRLGGQLGAEALKSHHRLRILGLDSDPCIILLVVIASAMFSKLKHLIIVELYCNLRIYVITLLCGLCVCDVLLCNYYFCNDVRDNPGETNRPFLRARCH